MKAWHFCGTNRVLGYDDGRAIVVGETLTVDGPPVLCRHGLHGSVRAIDALSYAVGPVACWTEITGDVVEGDDKIVGTARTVIWMADATGALREFARWCALEVAHLWDAPPVVLEYLRTGDERLREACYTAATRAAYADAYCAAAYAARAAYAADAADAARAARAARAAYAADAAARYAASCAAATLRADAQNAQNAKLTSLLEQLR